MTIIARKRISGLLEPVGAGVACFCLAGMIPWAIRPFSRGVALLSAWFCLGGLVFTVAGWMNWRPQGIGLVFDRQGLWWTSGKLRFLRWDDIAGARLVQWTDDGTEEHGLLVGLKEEAHDPLAPALMKLLTDELKKKWGPLPWRKAVILHDEKWQWNPADVLAAIEASLAGPAVRERW
jgi:hypothetical protein